MSDRDVTRVLIEPDTLQTLIRDAYIAGCEAVHANYQEDRDPDFSEAGYDYVASLDFTETTLPAQAVSAEPDVIAAKAREWAAHYPEASDGRNTFVLLAEWVERRP